MNSLNGQVAVITGASSGIGKAIALSLMAQGVTLCLAGRKMETLQTVFRSVPSNANHVVTYRADLTVDDDISELTRYIRQNFACVNILIHSAGLISVCSFDNATTLDFDLQYKINVRAPYFLTQELLPMLKSCQGQIVFINSSAGLIARATIGQYAATKRALKAIADSPREEVNENGVRVLSVYLGRTATPMQAAVHEMEKRLYSPEKLLQAEDVAAVIINALTLPRTAEVTDIHMRPLEKPKSVAL